MQKAKIKKAFGFLIIVIALGMVGIEFILSIFNSYGAQLDREIIKYRKVRQIRNDDTLQLIPKIANYEAHGMLTANDIYYRIIRRKAATVTVKETGKAEQKQGTSGGGGQTNLPAVNPNQGSDAEDSGMQDDAVQQPQSTGISQSLNQELVKIFKSNYSPSKDDLKKFQQVISGLSNDEHGKLMKTLLQEDVNIDKILTYNDEFFRALNDFLPKLNKEQKQVFFDRISDPYGNYSPASLQRISQTLDFFKTESAKKLKLKLTPSLFNTFVGIFGHEVDNIQAAMKYLIEKRIGLYKKMRFLNTPLYKIVSYLVTVILLLGLLGFIFKMEMSRVFIMFFGIIKIFFLLTVPIILFGGITGLLVILSIIAIVLSFISMYIVDLRTKSKTA